jgi:hypothetical protein
MVKHVERTKEMITGFYAMGLLSNLKSTREEVKIQIEKVEE